MRQDAFAEYYLTEQDESTVQVQLGADAAPTAVAATIIRGHFGRIRRRLRTLRRVLALRR